MRDAKTKVERLPGSEVYLPRMISCPIRLSHYEFANALATERRSQSELASSYLLTNATHYIDYWTSELYRSNYTQEA